MAMWRDPLDELIADLERSIPATTTLVCDMPPVEDVFLMVESVLSDNPENRRLLADDPRVKRAWEYYQHPPWLRQSQEHVEPKASRREPPSPRQSSEGRRSAALCDDP